jgi:p-aminobenzoyl-glutamate transporter AbgT
MRRRHHLLGHDVQPLTVLAAFLILGAAVAVAARTGGAWWAIPAGIVAPDLTFLAAGSQKPPAPGLMPHRAIRFYNAAHHPLVAIAGLTVTVALGFHTATVLALAWTSHIVWDRSVGYTLRDKNGAIRRRGRLASGLRG